MCLIRDIVIVTTDHRIIINDNHKNEKPLQYTIVRLSRTYNNIMYASYDAGKLARFSLRIRVVQNSARRINIVPESP